MPVHSRMPNTYNFLKNKADSVNVPHLFEAMRFEG